MNHIFTYVLLFLLVVCVIMITNAGGIQERVILQAAKLSPEHQFRFEPPLKFTELFFEKDDVQINGLFFKSEQQTAQGLVFYLHGNAGNMQRYGHYSSKFTEKGYDFFMMDYRSFGKSRGEVSEEAIHEDAQWIYEEVLKKYNYSEDEVVIYGRSLGSGIATKLASNNVPKTLILETPYYNIADVAKSWIPFLPYQSFLRYTFRTDLWLPTVKCPVYIFHGTADKIVPYSSGQKLAPLLTSETHFITLKNGGHNNLHNYSKYHRSLKKILDDIKVDK